MLAQKTQELSDRAHSEHDLKKAAKEVGATVKTSDLVDPDGAGSRHRRDDRRGQRRFSMKPGEISGPMARAAATVRDRLVEKQEPSPDEMKQNWDQAKETLLAAEAAGI